MARRNRKSRKAAAEANKARNVKPTAEEMKQEKTFFIWAAVITVVFVALFFWIYAG